MEGNLDTNRWLVCFSCFYIKGSNIVFRHLTSLYKVDNLGMFRLSPIFGSYCIHHKHIKSSKNQAWNNLGILDNYHSIYRFLYLCIYAQCSLFHLEIGSHRCCIAYRFHPRAVFHLVCTEHYSIVFSRLILWKMEGNLGIYRQVELFDVVSTWCLHNVSCQVRLFDRASSSHNHQFL